MMPRTNGLPSHLDPALKELLSNLEVICATVEDHHDNFLFLQNLLKHKGVSGQVKVYGKLEHWSKKAPLPEDKNAFQLLYEVCEELQAYVQAPEVVELCYILTRPDMRSLLDIHDQIANKEYIPEVEETLPPEDKVAEEEDEDIKVVRLVKSVEPLGATIKYDPVAGTVIIARIMNGGAADRSGLIKVGDQVLEVNGITITGKDPDEVINYVASVDGAITFKLLAADARKKTREDEELPVRLFQPEAVAQFPESEVQVRTHFDFDPYTDEAIPCPEAGLPFERGDILHIVERDDSNWWQARKEGERGLRAGLVPSRELQEKRELLRRSVDSTSEENMNATDIAFKRSGIRVASRSSFRRGKTKVKKVLYNTQQPDSVIIPDEIPTYEEITLYQSDPAHPRPVVLVGPPGVGKNELKKRLLATDESHYGSALPHTSRPKKIFEHDGLDYYFVSRQVMETAIKGNRLIEYGEYKGHLYGTSILAVKRVVDMGRVCLLTVHPQALKLLRASELKPFIVYVRPPPFSVLRETRASVNAKLSMEKGKTEARVFTDDDLIQMLNVGDKMESLYQHYFDHIVLNDNLQGAFKELVKAVTHMEREPQWVPTSWLR